MTLEEAANRLEDIIDRIDETIEDDTRLAIRGELIAFKRSLPWEPEFAELRQLAKDAFDDLGEQINRSVLNRMRERSKQLDKYIETITNVTSRTEKNIESLRLKHVRAVTTAAMGVADAIRTIKSSIEANDLPAAGAKTERALDLVMKMIEDIAKKS